MTRIRSFLKDFHIPLIQGSGTGSLKELYLWAKEMVLDWTYQAVVSTLLGRHKDEGFSLNFPEFLKDSLLLLRR